MVTKKDIDFLLENYVRITWNDNKKNVGFLVIEDNDIAIDSDGRHFYTLLIEGTVRRKPLLFHPEEVKNIEFVGENDGRTKKEEL